MAKILLISGDILPYPGFPTTGAGLRAWGLGKGLESRGHDVLWAMPRTSFEFPENMPVGQRPLLYRKEELSRFIRQERPDVVVLQHWRLANYLDDPLDMPLVIDFHGPLLLEIQFQNNPALEHLRYEKIQGIHKADFFTCAGEKQRHYFFPWLMLAGFDLCNDLIQTIPVSLSPELPDHHSEGETAFVYGGVFLPWQDPVLSLQTLVTYLENQHAGLLKFFGGKHPVIAVPGGKYDALLAQLKRSSRVRISPMIARDELLQIYCRAYVAMDLMQRNAERELAFTTRTVEYLWCGLPVIYNHYAELADYIRSYDAGWTLDPRDRHALWHVLEEIFSSPNLLTERSFNAQHLVREHLTWDRTIEPLDAFCRNPSKRQKKAPLTRTNHHSFVKQLTLLGQKVAFHLETSGLKGVIKKGWEKVNRT